MSEANDTSGVVLLTPDAMRRLADRLRQEADRMTDPRLIKKYRRRAAWWEDRATKLEMDWAP